MTLENVYHLLLDQGDLDEAMTYLASSHPTVRRRELSGHFSNRFLSQPQEQVGGVKETIANYLQAFTLAEFLEKHAPHYQVPRLYRKALVHGHCQHKAVMKLDCEKKVLAEMGLDCDLPDSGCCGMAGVFGFETEHYDVSIACGERVLLLEMRKAAKDTLIIADGFSCREQISQTTERQALHLAQVLQMAMKEGERGPPGNYQEKKYVTPAPRAISWWAIVPALAAGLIFAVSVVRLCRKRR
ncbi:MAG: hypothetical protein ACREIF_07005 [Chthoniobacterales bacterium]